MNKNKTLPPTWSVLTLLALLSTLWAEAATFPGASWETRTPAAVGLDVAKLNAIQGYLGGRGCIVRNGYLVYTWSDVTTRGDVASAAKPWYSTFLFKAVEEGRLASLDTLAVGYEPGLSTLNASLGCKDTNITFRHFANQTSCYGVQESPGAAFDYNDWQMALFWDTLFLKVYGATYANVDATVLQPKLTSILQCQDNPTFLAFGTGDRPGRLAVSPRDFARFGLLYLNRGNWNGTQVISQSHATMAVTSPLPLAIPRTAGVAAGMLAGQRSIGSLSIPDNQEDHDGSYSWLWWVNGVQRNGQRRWPDAPTDVYTCRGHLNGKRGIAIMPSQDIVLSWNDTTLDTRPSDPDPLNPVFRYIMEGITNVGLGPMTGQIIVDPAHPNRMVYSGVYQDGRLKPCFFAGPGDPEDFFYYNTTNNLNLLKARGARCTYVTAYLQDFGGGSPGSGSTLTNTLNAWESYITELENAGIITVFFFFDDSQPLPSGWETAVDAIVNKLEHHKLLIWSVAEEYAEALSTAQVSAVADRIKAADDHAHIIGVHQNTGTSFDFNGDSDLGMFVIQNNVSTASAVYSGLLSAWANTSGQKILNLAEVADHAKQDRTTVRRWNWAAAMGGASAVQVIWMGRSSDDPAWNEQGKYDDCAQLMDFMESATTLNTLAPRDDLAYGATQWVLANPGVAYIAYSTNAGAMGLKSMTTGNYYFRWLDIPGGTVVVQTNVAVSAGDQSWTRPVGIGNEAAVYVVNASNTPPGGAAINVLGNGITIVNGDSAPSAGDHTDFGSVDPAAGSLTRVFTIQNNGTLALTVSNVTLSGSSDFTLTSSPASSVAPGSSTTFNVTFDPSATGLRTATASISNNTASANPYTFAIQGRGVSTNGSLVGHWQFEEGTGLSTADASGYGAAGTLEGTSAATLPTWQPGKAGLYSLEFNSANSATDANISRVNVGNPSQFGFTTAMTIAAWVYLDAANTSAGSIVSKMGASGLRGWRLGNDNTSQAWELAIAPTPTSTLTYRATAGSAAPFVGTWTHVAGVYDGASQSMALYVNGLPISGSVVSGTIPSVMNSPAVNVALGGRANDFSQKWDGRLDDVRIYSTAESAAALWGMVRPFAQYQSRASGDWHAISSWNVRLDSSQSYVAATTTDQLPTSATVQGITLLNGHTLTVTTPVSLDQVTVNAGAQVAVSTGQVLTIDDEAGTDLIVNGTLSFNGTGKIAGAGSVSINSGGALVISDPDGIASSGAGGNIQNTGTRTYSTGANYTYAGTANQAAGSGLPAAVNNLIINNTGNTIALAKSVAVNGTLTLTAGVLNANGNDVAADKLSGLGTLNNTGTSRTLTVGGSGGSSAFGGVISGALTLNKTGVGALTLSNVSTHSGDTYLSRGTLALSGSGSLANTPLISLAAGATLSIAGIALAGYVLTGAGPQQTLACSGSAGTAHVDASGKWLELGTGALAGFKADGTSGTVGKIAVTGDLMLNANSITVEVLNAALGEGSYRLLECSGTLANSGVFVAPAIAGLGLMSGKAASLTVVTGAAGYVELQITTPAPVFLPPVLSGGQLILHWTGSGQLESAAEVEGPWTPVVPAPQPPYAVEVMTNGNQFFRLVNEP